MDFLECVFVIAPSLQPRFHCGTHVWIAPNTLSVGDYVFIGSHCYLAVPTEIGNFVMLASYVSIVRRRSPHRCSRHTNDLRRTGRQRHVRIADDVWIGPKALSSCTALVSN